MSCTSAVPHDLPLLPPVPSDEHLNTPNLVKDLPARGQRLVRHVDGYVATLVAGEAVFECGQHTSALPGRSARARR